MIAVWLNAAPKWWWGTDPNYERLRAQRRHDASQEPDPRRWTADLIANKLDELDWEVTYGEPNAPGSPPEWRSDPERHGVTSARKGARPL